MSETSNARTEQRRRLLKKAAAVPAIFVLPSTGRAVAGSSLHACVEKGLTANGNNPIPPLIPKDQTDQWVRQFQTGLPNQGADTVLEGNVLQYDISGAAPRPVAHASCWNSIHPSGPHADPNTNLIP
ncbi:MAG TPA: hypothetical protein PK440_12225 [Candidatus Accumulibacter phosphatis]|nr:MAG: hypothetical protein AW07_02346 [Candidatus Accumulibacter sp. SK-11]HAY25934.1 hypothetical protein [Accumulibacter sp.]HRL75657.1 hypothetical protein [Candidatus Accumulibacter phosphatis]HCN69383.1 hypothetical protein [Accumulibacter sp.]HCV14571.1 hypothetical protein [Accumulibacter sp.]